MKPVGRPLDQIVTRIIVNWLRKSVGLFLKGNHEGSSRQLVQYFIRLRMGVLICEQVNTFG